MWISHGGPQGLCMYGVRGGKEEASACWDQIRSHEQLLSTYKLSQRCRNSITSESKWNSDKGRTESKGHQFQKQERDKNIHTALNCKVAYEHCESALAGRSLKSYTTRPLAAPLPKASPAVGIERALSLLCRDRSQLITRLADEIEQTKSGSAAGHWQKDPFHLRNTRLWC